MADKVIQVPIPEGMTEDQLRKLVTKYIPQRDNSKKRDKAKREATRLLITAHQADYDKNLAAAYRKYGVTVKS